MSSRNNMERSLDNFLTDTIRIMKHKEKIKIKQQQEVLTSCIKSVKTIKDLQFQLYMGMLQFINQHINDIIKVRQQVKTKGNILEDTQLLEILKAFDDLITVNERIKSFITAIGKNHK